MTRLINIDNGGTLTDFCLVDGAYRPVLNVADNYGWPVVVRAESAVAWPHGTVPGVVAWLGSAAPDQPSGRWGVVAGTDFWDGAEPPPDAEIVLAAVPPDADLTPS